MTKQEEIREGIARELCYEWWNPITRWEDLDEMNRTIYYHLANAVVSYLHSQGVVIQVKGELPSIFDVGEDVISALEYKKKLEGYVAVEPLVEL